MEDNTALMMLRRLFSMAFLNETQRRLVMYRLKTGQHTWMIVQLLRHLGIPIADSEVIPPNYPNEYGAEQGSSVTTIHISILYDLGSAQPSSFLERCEARLQQARLRLVIVPPNSTEQCVLVFHYERSQRLSFEAGPELRTLVRAGVPWIYCVSRYQRDEGLSLLSVPQDAVAVYYSYQLERPLQTLFQLECKETYLECEPNAEAVSQLTETLAIMSGSPNPLWTYGDAAQSRVVKISCICSRGFMRPETFIQQCIPLMSLPTCVQIVPRNTREDCVIVFFFNASETRIEWEREVLVTSAPCRKLGRAGVPWVLCVVRGHAFEKLQKFRSYQPDWVESRFVALGCPDLRLVLPDLHCTTYHDPSPVHFPDSEWNKSEARLLADALVKLAPTESL